MYLPQTQFLLQGSAASVHGSRYNRLANQITWSCTVLESIEPEALWKHTTAFERAYAHVTATLHGHKPERRRRAASFFKSDVKQTEFVGSIMRRQTSDLVCFTPRH